MPEEKIGILIYEDNHLLRESLVNLLKLTEQFQVLGAFPNGKSIKHHLRDFAPHVILMDIHLGEETGIELVNLVRQDNQSVQIIMLTVFDDDDHVFAALRAGANGYILKKHISEQLAAAILDVINGGAPMSPSIARKVLYSFHQQPTDDGMKALSTREKEILRLLAAGNSYKMIAANLFISLDTVRTHIKHIYDKLQVHSQTEAILKVLQNRIN